MVKLVKKILKSNYSYEKDQDIIGLKFEDGKILAFDEPWDWDIDADTHTYNASVSLAGDYDNERLADLAKILMSLKTGKNEIPLKACDETYVDWETKYTDYETNDACRVPKCKYWYSSVLFESDPKVELCFTFTQNDTPWFTGDYYDFPDRYEFWNTDVNDGDWQEMTDAEASCWFDKTFGHIARQAQDKIDAKNKAEKAKNECIDKYVDVTGLSDKGRELLRNYVIANKITSEQNLKGLNSLISRILKDGIVKN